MLHVNTHATLETARFLAQDIASRADEADRAGQLPAADIEALIASGYLTISLPREYGGLGLSLRECAAAHLELAQGSASTAMVAGMPVHIFGNAREQRPWQEETFARFCRLVVEEGAIFNSAASEPALGSPSRGGSFTSYAELSANGDEWIVNGHKTWITGGKHLTHMIVKLSVNGGNGEMLVPQDAAGIEWVEKWGNALSMRASDSHDVHFKHVRVPKDNLIVPRPGKGGPSVWFPIIMSAVYLGAAIAARDATIRFALERVPTALGKPIATLPKIQRQIGEMDMQLQAARSLFLETAGAWAGDSDQAQAFLPRVAAAKLIVTRTANAVTDMALQVAGGQSITHDLPLERYFRDVRAGSMQPPSGDTALEIVGRAAIESSRNGHDA